MTYAYYCGHVKRLIRNKATKAFFNQGNWTEDFRLAQDFANVHSASKVAREFGLKEVEVYYLAGDELSKIYDFTIPLG